MAEDTKKREIADRKRETERLKRERILAAAAELFAEHGYHNVSMEAVAGALGVTKPYVYYAFRDKNAVLHAICARGAEMTFAAVERARSLSGSPLERIRAYCGEFIGIVIDQRRFLAVYSREELNLTATQRSEILSLRGRIDRILSDLIQEAQAAGEVEALDPPATATAVNLMISTLPLWYRARDRKRMDAQAETTRALALRMIGAAM